MTSNVLGHMADMLAKERPHPIGSLANHETAEIILSKLTEFGYKPERYSTFVCTRYGSCGQPVNIIAPTRSEHLRPVVAVIAHYDSVKAGPGAADNVGGVAIALEIARIIKPKSLPSDVVFIFTDGEESGLLGSTAFFAVNNPTYRTWAAINLDARGNTGPPLMFETSSAAKDLAELYKKSVDRPVISSVFSGVYQRMPNDTDFSVFKENGVQGYNLAYIGNRFAYHTSADSLAAVDPNTVELLARHALALTVNLASIDPGSIKDGDGVFFDVGNRFVVVMSSQTVEASVLITLLISVLMLVSRLGQTAGGYRFTLKLFAIVGFGLTASLALAVLISWVLTVTLTFPTPWIAYPGPSIIGFIVVGFAMALLTIAMFPLELSVADMLLTIATFDSLLSVFTVFILPEASYLFLFPGVTLLLAAIASLLNLLNSYLVRLFVLVMPSAVSFVVWLGIMRFAYDAMGLTLMPLVSFGISAIVIHSSGVLMKVAAHVKRIGYASSFAVAGSAFVIALTLEPYSAEKAAPFNILYHQDLTDHSARWLAVAPPSLRSGIAGPLEWSSDRFLPFPWSRALDQAFVARAVDYELGGATLEIGRLVRQGENLSVELKVVPIAESQTVRLALPPTAQLSTMHVEGIIMPPLYQRVLQRHDGWRVYSFPATPLHGLTLKLDFAGGEAPWCYLITEWDGVPNADKIKHVRLKNGAPFNDGDATIVTQLIKFQ
jgi:hypothetical protein